MSEFVVAFNVFSNGKHIWLQLHEGCFLYHILVSVCKVSLQNDIYSYPLLSKYKKKQFLLA